MEMTTKKALAEKNSEMEKLDKSQKSHIRMISSSAARLKMKLGKTEEPRRVTGNTETRTIRMYETHFPGFCYLRNGEYRKKTTNQVVSTSPDPVKCSEKVKAILFTDNELDIYKTMCLHLLGTHIQNKNHIQSKDGRLCSYVKAQSAGNTPHTLQPISQKTGSHVNDSPIKYDKMLPRYVLDIKLLQKGISTPSVKTYDFDSGSDEETKDKRKFQVPIYINNEIRVIINSVLEALEAVKSSKLNALIELASSPEELRNMLSNENLKEYVYELAGNPLITKPTSYDYVMTHLMFDKIPEKGTLETVTQVLEVYDDSLLKNLLSQIRKMLLHRHLELMNSNILPRKSGIQNKPSSTDYSSNSYLSCQTNSSCRYLNNSSTVIINQDTLEDIKLFKKADVKPYPDNSSSFWEKDNQGNENKKQKTANKADSRSVSIHFDKTAMNDHDYSTEQDNRPLESKESYTQNRNRSENIDSYKWNIQSLSNSQRILLGLKVASLKCKPTNMHQFEGKKKVDIAAIINPIIRPQITDVDYKQNSPENSLRNFSLPENKVKTYASKAPAIQTNDLENLTRPLLANLRLEISETENKKRVNKFMENI